MKDHAILVTGGAGFIGSNLVDLLMETDHTVFVIDDLSTGKLENIRNWMDNDRFRFVKGDIREPLDTFLTPSVLGGTPPIGYIFHLAAKVDVTSSFERPSEDIAVNYQGTLNVLEFALRMGVKKVIFSSSAAVFGDTEEIPIQEDAALVPLSPYGLNKLSSEHLIRIYHSHYGLGYNVLRFFNVYGPKQDPNSQYSGVISRFLERASSSEPMIIYGDGGQTRDFVYVGDIAELLLTAAVSTHHGVINTGTGVETSILELASIVCSVSGKDLKRVHLPEREGEIKRSVAGTETRKKVLGDMEMTDLREGLTKTMRWINVQERGKQVVH